MSLFDGELNVVFHIFLTAYDNRVKRGLLEQGMDSG